VPSFAVMALGVALIPLAGDFEGLLLASVVIGLGNGLGSGAMMTLGADLAPPGATGEFLGVWRLSATSAPSSARSRSVGSPRRSASSAGPGRWPWSASPPR
jgi:predicted MFS family arabinose efflux permease